MDEIRVMIADNHTVVRKGIRTLLATEHGIRVVGEARDSEDALHKVLALKPDVILMDLVMPKLDGVQTTRRIREKLPEAKILILTSLAEDKRIFAAIEAGALGVPAQGFLPRGFDSGHPGGGPGRVLPPPQSGPNG
jgi:NarL family two-component system response regulator LiaR